MEQIEFYEYSIIQKHCQVVQYKGVGTKTKDGLYSVEFFNGKKKLRNHRYVRLRDFELIHSFRILSFNDNYEYYKQILINAYTKMIEQEEEKIQKQKDFLRKLNAN